MVSRSFACVRTDDVVVMVAITIGQMAIAGYPRGRAGLGARGTAEPYVAAHVIFGVWGRGWRGVGRTEQSFV